MKQIFLIQRQARRQREVLFGLMGVMALLTVFLFLRQFQVHLTDAENLISHDNFESKSELFSKIIFHFHVFITSGLSPA